MVAVVTPTYAPGTGSDNPFEYGCAALNFDVQNATSPFVSLIATVNDTDGSSGIWEAEGPNGCTYEPMSNTGIVIVRHLLNWDLSNKAQYQLYSLIKTGLMP